ncbi:GDSL-type esterase/lipase family protein [Kurthia zopfii]|uniref:GDSL-type esterase/lipase family protein n=1 Tax=Kurthia zopfii TaxID=1650 RepID=UPI000F704692|nr:GDSL-type esterase/lipase family protein [Kurthia zopfii]VEI05229.1 GDSL-like Lipase/Acylhydrolase [Kurthia zopfii]
MKIVCFGDSLTTRKEGYPKPMLTLMLSEKVKGHLYINAGVAGNNTVEARKRIKEDVVSKHPDVVTILFGSNDCVEHKKVPLHLFKENLEAFVRKIGHKKVILITPPPVDESKQTSRTNKELSQYAHVVREVAAEQRSTCIDFFQFVYDQPDYEKLLVGKSDDGLHFGEKLYDQLTDLIAAELKKRERIAETPIWKKIIDKL